MPWTSPDGSPVGGCIPYSYGSVPNYVNCHVLNDTVGAEDHVCSKVIAGHANYADANMGFMLGKRVRCRRVEAGGPMQCAVYKVCLSVLSPAWD